MGVRRVAGNRISIRFQSFPHKSLELRLSGHASAAAPHPPQRRRSHGISAHHHARARQAYSRGRWRIPAAFPIRNNPPGVQGKRPLRNSRRVLHSSLGDRLRPATHARPVADHRTSLPEHPQSAAPTRAPARRVQVHVHRATARRRRQVVSRDSSASRRVTKSRSPDLTLRVERYTGSPERWNEFVRSQAGWTHFHLHGWREVMRRTMGHDTPYLVAIDDARDDAIAGVLPLVRVKSALFGHFLVSVPFLNYGGPLGSPSAIRALGAHAAAM